jgi:hypothetical protein
MKKSNKKSILVNKSVFDFFWKDEAFQSIDTIFLIVALAVIFRSHPKHPELLGYAVFAMLIPGFFYLFLLGRGSFKGNNAGKLWKRYIRFYVASSLLILVLIVIFL